MLKNLCADAGDIGLIPGPRRSQKPCSKEAQGPQRLSLRSEACRSPATELTGSSFWSLCAPAPCAPQQGQSPQEKPHAATRAALTFHHWGESTHGNKDPVQQKIAINKFFEKETEKTTHRMRDIFANYVSGKGLVSGMYEELLQLNSKNINNLIKNGQRIWTDILKRRWYKLPLSPWKAQHH